MNSLTYKRCNKCGETKPLSDFYTSGKKYYQSECKRCHNNRAAEYNQRTYDAAKRRDINLKKNYGVGIVEVEKLLQAQGGKCAICGSRLEVKGKGALTAHVDHDHKTGQVRGILCQSCNFILGHGRDDVNILVKAINYLLRRQGK